MRRAQRADHELGDTAKWPVTNGNEGRQRTSAQPSGIFLASSRNFLRPMSVSGMLGELLDHLEGEGADVGAELRGLEHVDRVAHAGHQHLGVVSRSSGRW